MVQSRVPNRTSSTFPNSYRVQFKPDSLDTLRGRQLQRCSLHPVWLVFKPPLFQRLRTELSPVFQLPGMKCILNILHTRIKTTQIFFSLVNHENIFRLKNHANILTFTSFACSIFLFGHRTTYSANVKCPTVPLHCPIRL